MMGKILDVLGFKPEDDFEDEEVYEEYMEEYDQEIAPKHNKIFQMPGKKPNLSVISGTKQSTGKQQVFIIRPKDFQEGMTVVERLKEDRVVVFSVEDTDYEMGTRIVDFVSGACFARDGHIQKISRNIFLAVPADIEIGQDFMNGSLENADSILSWAKDKKE